MLKKSLFIYFLLFCGLVLYSPISMSFVGGNGSLNAPYQITTCQDLQNIQSSLGGSYVLKNDINCFDTTNWNNGKGFQPIGSQSHPFVGKLDGQNHTIYNLYINRPAEIVGLFTSLAQGTIISNLTLSNVNISGDTYEGGLAGYDNDGQISNITITGSITGYGMYPQYLGGLFGIANQGHVTTKPYITNCHVNATITGKYKNTWEHKNGLGGNRIGGLVGELGHGGKIVISNSSSIGRIIDQAPNGYAGGLVGINQKFGIINSSYSSADIESFNDSGGLVGDNYGKITNCYATGNVVGKGSKTGSSVGVGGLVGIDYWAPYNSISDSYSIGQVSGKNSHFGGLIGRTTMVAPEMISNSYYNSDTSGQHDKNRGIPKTTAQMIQQSTFSGWDFSNTWKIVEGHDYPRLQWQKNIPLEVKFMPISSPQRANVPFTLTVVANQNDYNDFVALHSDRGNIDPNKIQLANGSWSGQVVLNTVGINNHLTLRWEDNSIETNDFADSNDFDIYPQAGNLQKDALLEGIVENDNSAPLANVSIALYGSNPSRNSKSNLTPICKTKTADDGSYTCNGIPAGKYYLDIQDNGYQGDIKTVQLAEKNRKITDKTLLNDVCTLNGKVPVLFIPGFMGSTRRGKPYIYPHMPFESSTRERGSKLKLLNIGNVVGWNTLKRKFKNLGYQKGCSFFDVPYDWTLPISQIRDLYLLPAIKRAQLASGSKQVSIVAHSMGGLVVRSYLQAKNYQNNVKRFAMVGTPNEGSVTAYPVWEGGDPIAADRATFNFGLTPGKSFYTRTLNRLWKTRGDSNKNLCRVVFNPKCSYNKVYDFIHHKVPSAGALLSIYPGAILDKTTSAAIKIKYGENQMLMALNNKRCLSDPSGICKNRQGKPYAFNPPEEVLKKDLSTSEVQTALFVGTEKKTTQSIYVKPSLAGTKLYKDGKPENLSSCFITGSCLMTSALGDKIVLEKSLKFEDYAPLKDILPSVAFEKTLHSKLIRTAANAITTFINTGQVKSSFATTQNDDNPNKLVVMINGRVQPEFDSFINTNGHMIQANISENEDKLDSAYITINNPAQGQYNFDLTSLYPNENYKISVYYYDATTNQIYGTDNAFIGYTDNNPTKNIKTIHLGINPTSTTPLFLDRPFYPPADLDIQDVNNQAQLTWNDPTGSPTGDVDHYEIFYCTSNDPNFKYLGKTDGTNMVFNTNQSWDVAKDYIYIVRAVLKFNGTTTFFSEPTFWIPDD